MKQTTRLNHSNFVAAICIGVTLLCTVYTIPAHGQRERWQKVDSIFAALQVEEGDTIADIGAGDGFFTRRLSPLVGSTGLVLAVDIDANALRRLERRMQNMSLANVRTVVNEPDDPTLQPNSIDGAFIVISYHEFTEHEAMLTEIKSALKPNARLVIVDNVAWDRSSSRSTQMQRHHMDIGIVEDDLEAAGFEVLERYPTFIDEEVGGRRRRQWMLVAVRGGRTN